jgi:hypothetical protein
MNEKPIQWTDNRAETPPSVSSKSVNLQYFRTCADLASSDPNNDPDKGMALVSPVMLRALVSEVERLRTVLTQAAELVRSQIRYDGLSTHTCQEFAAELAAHAVSGPETKPEGPMDWLPCADPGCPLDKPHQHRRFQHMHAQSGPETAP